MLASHEKGRLVTGQSETKGNTNLKGYVLVQRAHEFFWRENSSKDPYPRVGMKAVFLGESYV